MCKKEVNILTHKYSWLNYASEKYPCPPPAGEHLALAYSYWFQNDGAVTIPASSNALYTWVPGNFVPSDIRDYIGPYASLILLEKIQTGGDVAGDDVPIRLKLNGTEIHTEHHSKKQNHDFWLGINPFNFPTYNDRGTNNLLVENLGSTSVSVLSCFIYRLYKMNDCPCTPEELSAVPQELIEPIEIPAQESDTDPNMETKIKGQYRCDPGAGGRGVYVWKDTTRWEIDPNDWLQVQFISDNQYPSTKDCCIALLEKIEIDNDTASDDVPFRIKVNNQEMNVEYHSKKKGADIWIGTDLASSLPSELLPYNDTGTNYLTIENLHSQRKLYVNSIWIWRIFGMPGKP
jgi:hypothetical protein